MVPNRAKHHIFFSWFKLYALTHFFVCGQHNSHETTCEIVGSKILTKKSSNFDFLGSCWVSDKKSAYSAMLSHAVTFCYGKVSHQKCVPGSTIRLG